MGLDKMGMRELALLPKVWEDFVKEAGLLRVVIIVIWEILPQLLLCFLPLLLNGSGHSVFCNAETGADLLALLAFSPLTSRSLALDPRCYVTALSGPSCPSRSLPVTSL